MERKVRGLIWFFFQKKRRKWSENEEEMGSYHLGKGKDKSINVLLNYSNMRDVFSVTYNL